MGCELDKVVSAINEVASKVKNPLAINQLNELKNDLSTFARSKETAKPKRDFSRLMSVMSSVEVKGIKKNTPEFDKIPSYKDGQKSMTYAGIGSRETPPEILKQMTDIAKNLDEQGYRLQTGKTFYNKEEGADKAFSQGTENKELFGPELANARTIAIAKEVHPSPDRLKEGGLKLMARNTNQVFGKDLDTPVDFVLFYAKENDGSIRPEGGTGQAVEMARLKGIPTINMANSDWRGQLDKVLKEGKPISTSISETKSLASDGVDNGKDYSKLTTTLKNRVKDYTKFVTSDKANISVMRKLEDGSYGDFGNPFSKWTVKGSEEDLSAMFYDWLVNNNIPATYLEGDSNQDKRLKGINFQRGKIIDKLGSIANKDLYYEGTAKGKDLSHASTLALIASLYKDGKLSIDRNKKQNVLSKSVDNVESNSNGEGKVNNTEDLASINIYSGDKNGYEGLSNFNAGPITLNGKKFSTLEHAFQYWKATVASVEGTKEVNQKKILDAKTGADAQKAGRSIRIDTNKWSEHISTKALTTIMTRYYDENPDAMKLLQNTNGKTLTHIGKNGPLDSRFPGILMKIRDSSVSNKDNNITPTPKSAKEEVLPEARDGLTRGQTKAYDDLANILTSDIEHTYLLEGPGGTGKSFVIGKVLADYVENYKEAGIPIIVGSAVAHAAKDVLGDFIEGSLGEDTNVKFKRNVALQLGKVIDNHTTSKSNSPLVIILDEVSMVDSISINMLLHKVEFANSVGKPTKIVLLGDRAQLRPIMTTDRYKVEVKSIPGGESYSYVSINSIAYALNNAKTGLVNVSGDLVSGNVVDGYFIIDKPKFEKLKLKSEIFMSNLRGTTLLENMRNPELAKVFDKFRTGDSLIETSVAGENKAEYTRQYVEAVSGLKAAKNSKSYSLAVDLNVESLPDEVFKSWVNGNTSVVAYKNDTVKDINDKMTRIAAYSKGEKATMEVNKYGVFEGQAYRSTVNMLTPGMPTTKTTNNTLVTVTGVGNANEKLHNGTLEVDKGQSVMLYEGSAVLALADGKFREDPDNLYVYGLRLDMTKIPAEDKKNITIGTVRYPVAGKQNTFEEIAGILGYTGNINVTKLVKEYGEIVQYMYVEGAPTEVDTYSLSRLNYKAFEGIPSTEFDIETFKPTFAMTVHKSQGQTLENVIVVEEWNDWSKMSKVSKLESMYVAVSRSKTKVVLAGSSPYRLMNIAESKKKDAIIAPINSEIARNIQGCNK